MALVAGIDVGSNAMRLMVASVSTTGKLEVLQSIREPVRLGTAAFNGGEIPRETIDRTVAAFERFKSIIERHRVSAVRAVGTSALREARNSSNLRQRVKQSTGISIEVISGEEEARLAHLAISSRVPLGRRIALLIDIGGGSVELTIVQHGNIIMTESFKAGTVRLLQLFEARKKAPEVFARLVESYAHAMRSRLKRELGRRQISICVGTGGNFEALAQLRVTHLNKPTADRIKRADIEGLYRSIVSLSPEERAARFNLKPDRADVLLPAVTVIRAIMNHTQSSEILVPGIGVREGIVLDLSHQGTSYKNERERLLSFATALGQRYSFDEDHAVQVARLARSIFDQTRRLHGIAGKRGLLLEVAALLHDIGEFIHTGDHHKHSSYIISNTPFVGLSAHERSLVATLARYHRKSPPKVEHPEYLVLSREDRHFIRHCAAILRMADALDDDRVQSVASVKIRLGRNGVTVNAKCKGGSEAIRWSFDRKVTLFERVFQTECNLETSR